jgi:ribosomal protein S18 acetylase RimI-like enzyme
VYQLERIKTIEERFFVEKLKAIPRIHSRLIASTSNTDNAYILYAFEKMVGFSIVTSTEEGIEVSFVIAPEEENQGYGSILIDMTLNMIKTLYPHKAIYLHVLADNYKAYQVFRNQGFYSIHNTIKMKYEGKRNND